MDDINSWVRSTHTFHENRATSKSNDFTVCSVKRFTYAEHVCTWKAVVKVRNDKASVWSKISFTNSINIGWLNLKALGSKSTQYWDT